MTYNKNRKKDEKMEQIQQLKKENKKLNCLLRDLKKENRKLRNVISQLDKRNKVAVDVSDHYEGCTPQDFIVPNEDEEVVINGHILKGEYDV